MLPALLLFAVLALIAVLVAIWKEPWRGGALIVAVLMLTLIALLERIPLGR
jgi:hypothetical protein